MIVVMQCAGKKKRDAGHLCQRDGQPVLFVARPDLAPAGAAYSYVRPDDISDTGNSWREQLLEYNRQPEGNPRGLYPAWELYTNPIYARLIRKYGLASVYILSAGWGLIRADFLTPSYDITFSSSANKDNKYKRRRKKDRYDDLCMLPAATTEPVVFFGSKDYVPLFCSVTEGVEGQRCLFYNSQNVPKAPRCKLIRFHGNRTTNWQYDCANAFIDGKVTI